MTVLVLLGAPGAGKGTQAAILSERLGLAHVATGDMFRAAVADGTPVGLEAQRFMSQGQLVPDELTIKMLLERLDRPDAAAGAVLDGFPRTSAQAEALDRALAEREAQVSAALLIDVPTEDLVARLAGRWICEASGHVYHATANPPAQAGLCDIDGSALIQREDDRPATIRARLESQLGALEAVFNHYRSGGLLRIIDGRRPIDEVTRALLAATPPPGAA